MDQNQNTDQANKYCKQQHIATSDVHCFWIIQLSYVLSSSAEDSSVVILLSVVNYKV